MIAFDRDTTEVYCEAAAIGRIPAKLRFVNDSLFGQEGAQEILFGLSAGWALAAPDGQAGLDRGREELLFLRYNYARYRLALARSGGGEASRQAPEMSAWHERAQEARTQIAQANLALVVSMAARSRYSHVDFNDLVAEGNLALLRSIDTFDISRGFRFSTYAFRCVVKSFHRLAATTRRHLRGRTIELGAIGELAQRDDRGVGRQRQETIDDVREVLHSERSGLTSDERTVVIERFGLGEEGRRRTLRDLGTMLGLPHSRIRRLQKGALDKMRVMLGDEAALAR